MRNIAREAAFKIVFAGLFDTAPDDRFRAALYKKEELDEEDRVFAERIVKLYDEHREELHARLAAQVTGFAEHRIYPVDKAAMLVALTEMTYCEDVPKVVAVSEATAIARKYSTETSAGFVNGVLGGFLK